MRKLLLFLTLALTVATSIARAHASLTTFHALFVPWRESYSSWHWDGTPNPVYILWSANEKFPLHAKWQFAAVSLDDTTKHTLQPLAPCNTAKEWTTELWIPGSKNFPTDKLEVLGDGTFLCAMLANGQRVTNISRITIDHAHTTNAKPGVRVMPIILPGETKVQRLALQAWPAAGQEIYHYDVYTAYLCVDGVWYETGSHVWSGPNGMIQENQYGVAMRELDDYIPPIQPFTRATIQVKLVTNAMEQPPAEPQPTSGDAERARFQVEHLKGYLFDPVTITFDNSDAQKFDAALGAKMNRLPASGVGTTLDPL